MNSINFVRKLDVFDVIMYYNYEKAMVANDINNISMLKMEECI